MAKRKKAKKTRVKKHTRKVGNKRVTVKGHTRKVKRRRKK